MKRKPKQKKDEPDRKKQKGEVDQSASLLESRKGTLNDEAASDVKIKVKHPR